MLRKKAKSAVVWSGLDIFMRQGVGFFISVILARLLLPEDFGTIALLALFLGIAELFANAGFSAALIQRQDITHVDESTVFWFNIGAALVTTVGLFAISPWIADFFALPVLVPLTKVMACNILISATGSIHATLLTKRLDFKMQMKISAISTLISGCVAVYMAWNGYGVWALAGQALVSAFVSTGLFWFYNHWRPAFVFSRASFSRLFGFGSWVFASWLLETLYQRGYTLLIGKLYGIHDLGIYNRAESTQQLPSTILAGVLSRVAFPLYSSVNHDKERLRRGVRLSVRTIMLISAPSMMGLAILAEPFIGVVYGKPWLPAAPILQVLCIVGLLFPLQVINLNVLQAQGHAKLFFRLEIIKKCIGVVLLIMGSFYGVMGIAWAVALYNVVALSINAYYTGKFLDYGLYSQIQDCMPSIMLSVLMVVAVAVTDAFLEIGGIVELLLLIVLGAAFYLMGNILLELSAFKEAISFVKGDARGSEAIDDWSK